MNKKLHLVMLAFASVASISQAANYMTDSEVKQAIIQESTANYSGNCPCPYNTMRNGNACGSRSAYSKPGGSSPICYPRDVSSSMVDMYRRMHGG